METILVNNFSGKQARELISLLNNNGIFCYSKESGMGNISKIKSGMNLVDCHNIIVNEQDLLVASKILRDYRIKSEIEKTEKEMKCAKCGAKDPTVTYKDLNFWQRIYYFGTKPKQCKFCGIEWI